MKNVFAVEAFKFGFKAFAKNFWFLFLSMLASVAIFIGGLIASILASLLFLIPFYMVFDKIKETFFKLALTDSVEKLAQGVQGVQGGVQAGVDQVAQSWAIWSKFFVEVFYGFPFSIAFAILGIFVFITLIFSLLVMLGLGLMRIALNITDNRENKISALFVRPSLVIRALCISSILLFLAVVPFVAAIFVFKLNIIAGVFSMVLATLLVIYFGFKFAFNKWFLLDRFSGIIESLRLSFGLKNGVKNIIILSLLSFPIYIFLALLKMVAGFTHLASIRVFFSFLNSIGGACFAAIFLIAMAKLYRVLTIRSY